MSVISGDSILNKEDIAQIESEGKPLEKVLLEVETFKRGIPYVNLSRPATIGSGIVAIDPSELGRLSKIFDESAAAGRMMKFTPASGAASRMFKLLLSFYHREEAFSKEEITHRAAKGEEEFEEFLEFLDGLELFAFYDELQAVMSENGLDIKELADKGLYREILEYILTGKGLDYASLPKGLIKFHSYDGASRNALDEHLVEAASYAKDRDGICRVHFTLSEEHKGMIESHIDAVKGKYQKDHLTLEVGYSIQNHKTDTIAVDMDNLPFRDADGRLLFRPAGHGALLENMNNLKGDIIFVKNIDNVVPDRLKGDTFLYKKVLAGYLAELQEEIFSLLRNLDEDKESEDLLSIALQFMREKLLINIPQSVENAGLKELSAFVFSRLNRPARVCGMVKNEGEPGGGPFWIKGKDGTDSLQIVEKSQVDIESDEQKAVLEGATHFNPVDLVCGVRDYRGEPFDLMKFADPDTGFISIKSNDGSQLKALELPGLWNGAMADWISIFVEVPISTFNPVKTVLDLLRREHQA
ncbi:MAG: DUF4301 family protein [bacterium]|nr:DUF4301 family protein [bacterium]